MMPQAGCKLQKKVCDKMPGQPVICGQAGTIASQALPMKKKLTPIFENVAESTTACLITMVQGNLLALTVSHWLIASQTGVVAGACIDVRGDIRDPDPESPRDRTADRRYDRCS